MTLSKAITIQTQDKALLLHQSVMQSCHCQAALSFSHSRPTGEMRVTSPLIQSTYITGIVLKKQYFMKECRGDVIDMTYF